MRAPQRYLGLVVLLAMAGFAALGYQSIRRDVESLRAISRENILWTATQMEVELLRFQLSVADLAAAPTPEALDAMRERFNILWSRVFMMGAGRIGELIERYDEGFDSIPRFQQYLKELDPVLAALRPDDAAQVAVIRQELVTFQHDLRLYTLRVVRGDTEAAAAVRDRLQLSSQMTAAISLAAILLSALALALILRENRRQREMAELDRRLAQEAETASRAKSRFLTTMSHELRNPLNGVLGPLALLRQSDLPARQRRLVEQAQQSGAATLQMLSGLLDHAELQDGRLRMRRQPFRLGALAEGVGAALADAGETGIRVEATSEAGDVLLGDLVRLRDIFVNLGAYVRASARPGTVEIAFARQAGTLVGELRFVAADPSADWKLELVTGLNEPTPDQLTSEALRPLIARGLIAAAAGVLELCDGAGQRRSMRVVIPAPSVRQEPLRIWLETRSGALAAIYRASLRSDRVSFVDRDDAGPVDVVLVDASSLAEETLMARLRARHPGALFVSLGAPDRPESFDDIVETPADMGRLRHRILGDAAG
ncbi:histidine kinase dimerization/phospho-acceptor domain-containing protein [Amaricoccus sp.]|uniref:sensor histidine kinase n=1 Tax=Amaricoccus sp. TaxID=1872485 RepID=UPI001B59130F|nr:histidine kinase dimerization/phospho-acceptor domain-containing protein [Amaricoccus sp.]MBP7000937.1 hypothetical protein [Amaricoccus sp.]